MNLNFTKFLAVFCLVGISLQIGAQSRNTMTINFPASIAGEYEVVNANFGDTTSDPFTGDLLLIEDDTAPTSDGCTGALNDMTGFIALVDRGGCPFVDKAATAQAAGAIAMVVCQNDPAADPFAMGGDAPDITIPCVMASFATCQTIKAELGSGVNISVEFVPIPCDEIDYPATTVWGQNGEGAFSYGLNDWVSIGVSAETDVWIWDIDGIGNGLFGILDNIDSPSVCDGAALMDFDDLTTSVNPNPAQPYPVHTSDLLSPPIDMTGLEFPILHFYQYNLPLGAGDVQGFVSFSNDGGSTWLDTIPVPTTNFFNAGGGSTTNETGEFVRMPLIGGGNTDQFRVKFIGSGTFYFWLIDDVYLTNEELKDVRTNENWFSTAPNFRTPSSQVDMVPFMVDVENVGNVTLDNVSVTASISKDGAELYSATLDYGTMLGGQIIENQVFDAFWPMDSAIGVYSIAYTISADGDETAANNTVSANFEVTENMFGKVLPESEAGAEYLSGTGSALSSFYSMCNAYYVPNGAGYEPTHINVGFANDAADWANVGFTTLTAQLREWSIDANGDTIANLDTETVLIAEGSVLIDPAALPDDLRNIRIDLEKVPGIPSKELSDNTQYLAIVHVSPLSPNEDFNIFALNSDGPINRSYYFGPMQFAFENSGTNVRRYGTMWDPNGVSGAAADINSRNLETGIGQSLSWYLPLGISLISSTVDINNNIAVNVFPNPASHFVNLELGLEAMSKDLSVQVLDLKGQIMKTSNFTNVQNETLQVAVSDLTSGVYMVNIFTDNGMISKRIVVQN